MKIFIYSNIVVNDFGLGITKKVLAQIKAVKKLGYTVYYTGYTDDGVAVFDNNENIVAFNKYPFKNPKIRHAIRRNMLLLLATQFIKSSNIKFDTAYLRHHYFDATYLKLLRTLKKINAKIIVEAHSYPNYNWSIKLLVSPRLPVYVLDFLYAKKVHKYIDLIAAMSSHKRIWSVPALQIENTVYLDEMKPKNPQKENNIITLIAVAYEALTHGYDRIVNGLYQYYSNGGKREIIVNFVGRPTVSTVQLVKRLGMEERYVFNGIKINDDLDYMYDISDIAIGHLGNHRIGSYSGSSIKVVEYLAKGIPFIYAWRELRIDDSFPYALKFELCDEPIDFIKVVEFYDDMQKVNNLVEKMRGYASDMSNWEEQFKKVFDAV